MPKFRIYGADSNTAEDTSAVVTADTPHDAESIAGGRGILVSRVVEIEVERVEPAAQPAVVMAQQPPTAQPNINVVVNQQQHQQTNVGDRHKRWSPIIAMLLSFFIPGLGQLYKGQVISGVFWFCVVLIGYFLLVIPGLILHLCCFIGAGLGDPYRR